MGNIKTHLEYFPHVTFYLTCHETAKRVQLSKVN